MAECFRTIMSRESFLLLRALCFDDIKDHDERKKTDKLASIRQVFEEFISQCKNCYQVGEYVTNYEMLEAFRNKCKFWQYATKYGIKIHALTDEIIFYTKNLEIYRGKQLEGNIR